MMIIGPPFYAIFANLAYTVGPLLDTIVYCGAPRKHLLKAGYIFSVVLTALPGVWALAAWFWTLATGAKLDWSGPTSSIDAKILDKAGVISDFFRIKTLLIGEKGNEGIPDALR